MSKAVCTTGEGNDPAPMSWRSPGSPPGTPVRCASGTGQIVRSQISDVDPADILRKKIQRSTGTDDKAQAQEFHDRLKAQVWEEHRLGLKPQRSWKAAVVRWLEETSDKATHEEDRRKLKWLDSYLGNHTLDEINLEAIDIVRTAKLKEASKATTNRYLALVRAILLRARDEWEWVDKVPTVRLFRESISRERALTVEQAKTLLNELPDHQREVVLFALVTGLRQQNVLRLCWPQVNL